MLSAMGTQVVNCSQCRSMSTPTRQRNNNTKKKRQVDEGRKKAENKRLGQMEKWKIEEQLKPHRHTHTSIGR